MGARVLRRLQYPAPLLVITICFFWKLTLSRQYTWLDQPDIVYQVMPWLQFQASEWHSGRFPLWDPHLLAGQPLAGQVQTGTLNPLNWLLFAAPPKNGFISRGVLHWYFVMIHYLGALLFYWLCRGLKLSPVSSLLAGCAFGMGGFLGITVWPQLLFSAVWMPLVLMLFLWVMRDKRPLANAAWCGAVMGLSLLGTHHNVPLFFGVALGGLWIASSRRLLPAALFVVCFLLVASPQILTARELGELSLRWVNAPEPIAWGQKVPYSVHQEYSNGPASVLGIVIPGFFRHTDPFLGLVVVSLAAMAGWKKKTVRLFLALAAWGLFCSLGSAFFLHGVLYSVLPYLNMARNPSMAIAVFHLGAIGLAAFGLDACRAAPESCRRGGRQIDHLRDRQQMQLDVLAAFDQRFDMRQHLLGQLRRRQCGDADGHATARPGLPLLERCLQWCSGKLHGDNERRYQGAGELQQVALVGGGPAQLRRAAPSFGGRLGKPSTA